MELDYPCNWEYKLIVHDESNAKEAAKVVLTKREYKIIPSKVSKKGKFKSFTVSTLVHNEEERVMLFEHFRAHEAVKMVI